MPVIIAALVWWVVVWYATSSALRQQTAQSKRERYSLMALKANRTRSTPPFAVWLVCDPLSLTTKPFRESEGSLTLLPFAPLLAFRPRFRI